MLPRATIVALGDTAIEANALRSVLECVGYEIRLLRVGAPRDANAALLRAAEDDLILLSAHGGPRGFHLGAFDTSVDTTGMVGEWMPAQTAFEGVELRDETVLISTACGTRENGVARAMMGAGGRLIAPNGYPEGRVIVPWIAACLLASEKGIAEAVMAANALVAPENHFSYG